MKVAFISLNVGLGYMLFVNLVPMGMLQLYDSFQNGYWHARAPEFFMRSDARVLEWLRLPGDVLFIVGGIVPVVVLAVRMFLRRNRYGRLPDGAEAETFTAAYEEV